MIKYACKIKDKKKKRTVITHKINDKIGDWQFNGYMPTGEPVWYNSIDDYILMMHIN